eukprot:CAMPEP_0206539034 /NCGR_PEP_ID=MMETSP0325_2-20121206/8216_1 /ASSEMBLY_ACC=CAM_ASM_000347 /TAXON_ID=2866 /ORGANISM="Crypthecodinium cohnii, Strain Seligo" /LENGTH=95 /DNA_ID=CAMNT_0054036583 /DNA_START=463 /DNA_END=750 /DNA_ORIENTATION=+
MKKHHYHEGKLYCSSSLGWKGVQHCAPVVSHQENRIGHYVTTSSSGMLLQNGHEHARSSKTAKLRCSSCYFGYTAAATATAAVAAAGEADSGVGE